MSRTEKPQPTPRREMPTQCLVLEIKLKTDLDPTTLVSDATTAAEEHLEELYGENLADVIAYVRGPASRNARHAWREIRDTIRTYWEIYVGEREELAMRKRAAIR